MFILNFLFIPWLAATLTAVVAAPIGSLITWRRLIYFGETIAHSALLGIAISLHAQLPTQLGIWIICLILVIVLHQLKQRQQQDANNILGTLSHIALAAGMLAIAKLEHIRTDLTSYLFGDILATTASDLRIIIPYTLMSLLLLKPLWQALILITISPSIAKAEIAKSSLYDLIFLLILAGFIGLMAQYFGLLLVVALLIIPANAAASLAQTPEQSVCFAALIGVCSTTIGMIFAWQFDYAVSPSIVCVAGALYFFIQIIACLRS